MIKRDFHYIIRRVILFLIIGIIISFTNSCKVKAMEYTEDNYLIKIDNVRYGGSDQPPFYVYYNDDTNSLDFYHKNSVLYSQNLDNYPYVTITQDGPVNFGMSVCSTPLSKPASSFSNCVAGQVYPYKANGTSYLWDFGYDNNYVIWGNNYNNFLTNYDIYNTNGTLFFEQNMSFDSGIAIVSLNPFIVKSNNVITGMLFSPEFSEWDTEKFKYQYSFNSTTLWLDLTQNNEILHINGNGTLIVRVLDRENNDEFVVGQTYTISRVGTLYDSNVDYDITFNGEYRTIDYLQNNISSKSQSEIVEYDIDIYYSPISSYYEYWYQFVVDGYDLNPSNWTKINDLTTAGIGYSTSSNGTMYAKITDSEGNVLITKSYTVDSIGEFAFDNGSGTNGSNSKINRLFTSLNSKLNYNGPIYSILNIPYSIVNAFYESISSYNGYCANYDLGSLLGTHIYLPCVNVKSYLGNDLYNTIDVILSCVMFYMLVKMLLSFYVSFTNLEKDPAGDVSILYNDRRF